MKNDVETAEEADEECPGHRTANEEAGSIVLRVGHVEHDMNERVTFVISNEEICPEGEATIEHKREGTNEKQTENVIETDCLGDELLEQCVRADDEAGSILLHGHDMNEKEKNNEEADDAAAHRGEKNHTQRREATIDRSEQADSKIRNQIC